MPCDDNETMVSAFAPEVRNYAYNLAVKTISHVQRGYSVQILQVHAPQVYRLTTRERSTIRTMCLSYNVTDKFDQYNWQNGFLWIYGHGVHVQTIAVTPGQQPTSHNPVYGWAWDSLDKARCPMRCDSFWVSTKPLTILTPTQSGSLQSTRRAQTMGPQQRSQVATRDATG